MVRDRFLHLFPPKYPIKLHKSQDYHTAASYLRSEMRRLPTAEHPNAAHAYKVFLDPRGPVQQQFRILDEQVPAYLHLTDVAADWYELVPVWFRVNNRIREALAALSAGQTVIMLNPEDKFSDTANQDIFPAWMGLDSSQDIPQATLHTKDAGGNEEAHAPNAHPDFFSAAETSVPRSESSPEPTPVRTGVRPAQHTVPSRPREILLLSGAAGTGKTHRLEAHIHHLTDRLQVPPQRILVPAHSPLQAERLTVRYHLELELPLTITCITASSSLFTVASPDISHVVWDDLQNFTHEHLSLMHSLASRIPDAGWFCTIDDWQALGSDYITPRDFTEVFPGCNTECLTEVYRHHYELARNAALFVLADPLHTRKEIEATEGNRPGIHLICYSTQPEKEAYEKAFQKASQLAGTGSVLLPVHQLQDAYPLRHFFRGHVLPCMPEHLSDAEADVAVLPPSFLLKLGCPLISLDGKEELPEDSSRLPLRLPAAERRLLYCALTRAKHCSIILSPLETCSAFVRELQQLPIDIHILND